MPIQYRLAGMSDVEELVALRYQFLEEANSKPVDPGIACAIREALLRQMPSATTVSWVASDSRHIVGTGSITFWERLPNCSSPNGRCGEIANMYTLRAYRGQGIASNILGKLLDEACSRDVHSISLHALPAGAGIYLKAGFVPSGNAMSLHHHRGQ